jgi:predicted flavoprotein YhiN
LETLLRGYLPSQLINPFLKYLKIQPNIRCKLLKQDFSNTLAKSLKSWKMDISNFTSYERAVITAGGVELNEIISKNMKSKLCDNLFFAGEIIDLDGDTGGYNLQIAFSTGALAGYSAAQSIITSGNSKLSAE